MIQGKQDIDPPHPSPNHVKKNFYQGHHQLSGKGDENKSFQPYFDRTLLLFSPPMRDKDTYALREMFQYSSLAEKPLDQWEIATH